MYLFSRLLELRGDFRKTMGWVAEITEYVNTHSQLGATCWMAQYGYPVGTVGWSAVVESQADLAARTASIAADDGYWSIVEKGAEWTVGAPHDLLREMLHGAPPEAPPAIGAISTIVTATAANGKLADAMAWGVSISEHYTKVTGVPVAFFADAYGNMGQVTWIGISPDWASVDAARAAIASDAAYLESVDRAGNLFLPGSSRTGLLTRIA
jgi:hypothetical protein